jgi:prophage tail gpP-like protein
VSTDHAELECNGVTIDAWTDYSIDSDLFQAVDGCELSIAVGTSKTSGMLRNLERLKAQIPVAGTVKLWITSGGKRALQGVFIVDSRAINGDADGGTKFTVKARDLARHLVQNAADPKLYHANDTLVAVAKRACEPWGIEVTADHVAARDLRQARITKDKLARYQAKARSWGIPPRFMSEKIAVSIEKGTITFEDFVAAQAGGLYQDYSFRTFDVGTGQRLAVSYENTTRPLQPGGVPLRGFRGMVAPGIPWSGATGLSSLQIYQLKLQDIRPQGGETRWDFLDRHARRNGLLMSMSPEGKLLLCGMHYEQEPSYRLVRRISDGRENNIISGGVRDDISNVYGAVTVYGRAKGKDKSRSPFKGYAETKPGEPFYLPFQTSKVVRDNSIKTKEDAQHRAEYELALSKQGARAAEYSVFGHSQNGVIWAPDTIVQVDDDVAGIHGPMYVTARTFSRSNRQIPQTSLKLVDPGSIVLSREGVDSDDG